MSGFAKEQGCHKGNPYIFEEPNHLKLNVTFIQR